MIDFYILHADSNKVVFGGQCDKARRAGVKGGGGDIPCTKNLGFCQGPDDNMCNYNCRHDDYPLGFCGECVLNKQTGKYDCICHLCY